MAQYRTDTRVLNALLTTTLDEYGTEMADTIFTSTFAYYMFKKKGCFQSQDGGAYTRNPIMFQANSTAAWMSGYDIIDVTPQDGMTDGVMPWATLAGAISISREEERKNSGKHRLINLLDQKIKQLEMTMIQKVDLALFGTGAYNISQTSKQMAGLQAWIAEVPASYNCAGLSATDLGSSWQNKVYGETSLTWTTTFDTTSSPVTTIPTGQVAMRHLYNCCGKGAGGFPDVILCNQYAVESYEGGLTVGQRFSDESVASAGFDNVKFRGATLGWDEYTASASVAAGSTTTALMYFINTKFLRIVYDSQSLFSHEGFIKPENQLAKTALVVFMANMMSTNRRKNGILAEAALSEVE